MDKKLTAPTLKIGRNKLLDKLSGLLLGFPLAFPGPPFYLLAFLAFSFSLLRIKKNVALFIKLALLIVLALISNFVALSYGQVTLPQAIYTSVVFVFFLFGFGLRSFEQFFDGFVFVTNMLSIAVLVIFVATRQYEAGINLFISPTLRLWGDPWFPDWPNFFGSLLGIGFLLKVLLRKPWYWILISAAAILLTTSRTPLLAILIGLFFYGQTIYKKRGLLMALIFIFGSVATILVYLNWFWLGDTIVVSDQLQNRIFKFNDRQIIWTESLRLIQSRPILGHGSVQLSTLSQYGYSFHNSYTEILIRHGIVAFVIWVAMLFPAKILKFRSSGYLHMVLYIALASMFNNLLKHPYFLMFLSVWIAHAADIHVFLLSKIRQKAQFARARQVSSNPQLTYK
ncbi:MAG: O-antigen ligase family protein [Anaerolineae bacterium]